MIGKRVCVDWLSQIYRGNVIHTIIIYIVVNIGSFSHSSFLVQEL